MKQRIPTLAQCPPLAGELRAQRRLWQADPLWRRAPSRDGEGRMLGDFLMLIPGLAQAQELRRERICVELDAVFRDYRHLVRFADLNLRLSLLWISVEPGPGNVREVARAIRGRIPEARLVGQDCGWLEDPRIGQTGPAGWRRAWRSAARRLGIGNAAETRPRLPPATGD